MSKKTDERKKNVVVVGGGFAGIDAAKGLAKQLDHAQYNLVLLSARPYFVNIVAALRTVVSSAGQLEEKVLVPYDRLQNVAFVQGRLVEIAETAPGKGGVLVLADGDRLEYAALVLATGSTWPSLIDFGDADEEVREKIGVWRRTFAQAKNVVIAGGGSVGIELAGEILDAYPNTKVTIVHSGTRLLNDAYPDKFRDRMEQTVRARGVALVAEDYVDVFPEPLATTDVVTRAGKIIRGADLVIPAFGARPNTGVVATLGGGVLTASGHVRVAPTLEVRGHPGVYAAGDIVEWREQKQAGKASAHAAVVVPNVVSFLRDQPQAKVYEGSREMIVIPVGRAYGAGYFDVLWGIVVGNWLTSVLKGKDLIVGMIRGRLNY
ncbi:uncharacterized protein PHACADRAFT_178488 [Phanerochaete carnosa HHB-10118-sp]|uniref:FAD/NAD(P)-binding domain-containing protein n=1 Tax=Phanerochaete carnosa (strain HHB-10118-sp) TaxID=650164 RepID=K5UM07_PHACS|nr:uncharacterized protein PHACADRAFT_178488 [Phanerochaete carnosa HHB-10118-sp]EKM50736.1 hypothetical protein PHACADRAFT_178488 [Phanerochaete carnosa HHB-10118-sp]